MATGDSGFTGAGLERLPMIVDGKPASDTDITRCLSDHVHEHRHSNGYEDRVFAIKYVQKGTAHIAFKRPEPVNLLNDIIARRYQ